MKKDFMIKLKTENYLIGSYDVYQDESKELISNNPNWMDENTEDIVKAMPTVSRATVLDSNGNYIGYIGLYNVDAKNNSASLRFEVKEILKEENKEEIVNEFKQYCEDSLNITQIKEYIYKTNDEIDIEKNKIEICNNIIVPNKMLEPGISDEV